MSPGETDPEVVVERAIAAAGDGRPDEAVSLMREVVAAHPEVGRFHDLLGSALQLAGDVESAVAAHLRAMELDGDTNALVRYNLGVARNAVGNVEDAEADYRRAIELDPDMAMAHGNLGTLLQSRGDLAGAEDCYRHALAANDANPWVRANLASLLCALGRFEEAEAEYRATLEMAPGLAQAHHGLGAVLAARDDAAGAVASYRRAIELNPRFAESYQHLARLLIADDALTEALELSIRAVELAPRNAIMRNSLGVVLELHQRYEDAQTQFRAAIELDPTWGAAHYNLGVALEKNEQFNEAVAAYRQSLEYAPESHVAVSNLAGALRMVGLLEASEEAYRRALEIDPTDDVSRHLIAAMSGEITAAPPAGYVRSLFDHYAPRYDDHMVRDLRYQGPVHVVGALVAAGLEEGDGVALDLGCGTGLVGNELRRYVGELHGVDLSEQMIAVAAKRGIYDSLFTLDMVDMLTDTGCGAAAYDVVTAADVLIYLGDLAPLLRAARARLAPGGVVGFTVEAFEGDGYTLRDTGRYAHSRAYVEREAAAAGFVEVTCADVSVRLQSQKPVAAHVFVLR